MKKLIIWIIAFACTAGACAAAEPVTIHGEILNAMGYDAKAKTGAAEMRSNRAKLDEEAKDMASLDLDSLRIRMTKSEDKTERFRAAWTIIRKHIPDGDLRNLREASYTHLGDLPFKCPPALVYTEAFFVAVVELESRGMYWNVRELYEQFACDPITEVLYDKAPQAVSSAINSVSMKTGYTDRIITKTKTPSVTQFPIAVIPEPFPKNYEGSVPLMLDKYGLPVFQDSDKADLLWDTQSGKIYVLR